MFISIFLIVIGVLFLLKNIGIIQVGLWGIIWPVTIILIGVWWALKYSHCKKLWNKIVRKLD